MSEVLNLLSQMMQPSPEDSQTFLEMDDQTQQWQDIKAWLDEEHQSSSS